MRRSLQVSLYGLLLVVAFIAATGIVRMVGPFFRPGFTDELVMHPQTSARVSPDPESPAPSHDSPVHSGPAQPSPTPSGDSGHSGHSPAPAATSPPSPSPMPDGLQISAHGYTLELLDQTAAAYKWQDLRFRILDAGGHVVTRFAKAHEKYLHLVIVRRDLSQFFHVHPKLNAGGEWRSRLMFDKAGTYRVIADFLPLGAREPLALGADLLVPGEQWPSPLPQPHAQSSTDGYRISFSGSLRAERPATLSFSVRQKTPDARLRQGAGIVPDLEQHLGAYGHLVVLRAGDLAYLHAHPIAVKSPGAAGIPFQVTVPSPGKYRLFFEFRHRGIVRTVPFTFVATR